jgi:hypothetical protein
MDRCPLCRAMLNGADTCRRCRADLGAAQRVERDSQALVGAAIHRLTLDDTEGAARLLQRALALHAAPDVQSLWESIRRYGMAGTGGKIGGNLAG